MFNYLSDLIKIKIFYYLLDLIKIKIFYYLPDLNKFNEGILLFNIIVLSLDF